MKNIVLITVSLLLIITKADTDTCTTYTTEDACKKGTKCAWTAANCKGGSGTTCTSKTTSDQCTVTSYTGNVPCTYTAESDEGACDVAEGATTSPTCNDKTTKTTCTGTTDCEWTPTTPASCAGGSTCSTAASSKTTCEGTTYSGSANCAWVEGSCAAAPDEDDNTNNDNGGDEDDSSFGLKVTCLIYLLLSLF